MRCYKGFNKDLTCTMGKGSFKYKVGETFTAEAAKCASTGLHCVEEPIEVLTWYRGNGSRYCVVEAAGDINENGAKICCTEMKILKEITLQQLGMYECIWIQEHPEREESSHVHRESGCAEAGEIVIVRGKHPKAAGKLGCTLFLLREKSRSKEIADIGVFKVDGKEFKPDVYYTVEGRGKGCAKKH